jgi:hypothetical protein
MRNEKTMVANLSARIRITPRPLIRSLLLRRTPKRVLMTQEEYSS